MLWRGSRTCTAPGPTCCSSRRRDRARWSPRSRTCAPPETASPSSATARSASAGSRSASSTRSKCTRSGTSGASRRTRARSAQRWREAGVEIVLCQQSDTSTGVVADVRGIKEAVGGAVLVVDAISSLGAVPLQTDAWGIDVAISGSQKALMCPPGLATVSVPDARPRACGQVAELLLRLACQQGGAGQARCRLHPGGLADQEPRCRARHAARRRTRGGVRASCATRSRRPCGHQGDGARAVLARRRHRRRRHRRPRSGRRGFRRAVAASSRTSRRHARARARLT